MLEQGKLFRGKFRRGGVVDSAGRFAVEVPDGGHWGLHGYADGYIYHPESITLAPGKINRYRWVLSVDKDPQDNPTIRRITLTPDPAPGVTVTITLDAFDPKLRLSEQVLALNARTGDAFVMEPPEQPRGVTPLKASSIPTGSTARCTARCRPTVMSTTGSSSWPTRTAASRGSRGRPWTTSGVSACRRSLSGADAASMVLSDLKRRRSRATPGPITRRLYLDLLKKSLMNEIGIENELRIHYLRSCIADGTAPDEIVIRDIRTRRAEDFEEYLAVRRDGNLFRGQVIECPYTMIGRKRLDNLELLVTRVIEERVPGDVIECGVWRGGASIFICGVLLIRLTPKHTARGRKWADAPWPARGAFGRRPWGRAVG